MTKYKIEIYIKLFDVIHIERMFADFFNKEETPAYPIYILDPFRKPLIVEASKKKRGDEDNIPLARIYSKSYPSKRILIIEGIEGQEGCWGKVENFARKIIERMKILDFGVGLITPESLFVEVATEETKNNNIKAPIITQAKVLPEKPSLPWEQIVDHRADRKILRLWWEGYINSDIGRIVGLAPRTITNIIFELRKRHGEKIVPTDVQRREILRNKKS